LKGQMFL